MTISDSITVSIDVTNTGSRDGAEVIQLYIRDLVGSVTRPVKELKDFKKVSFKAGEKKTIAFTINANDLSFYNSDLKWVSEPGEFTVFVGGNSRDVKEAGLILK
jgi:beta-glucosidase